MDELYSSNWLRYNELKKTLFFPNRVHASYVMRENQA